VAVSPSVAVGVDEKRSIESGIRVSNGEVVVPAVAVDRREDGGLGAPDLEREEAGKRGVRRAMGLRWPYIR
jgi:hypothetical protein